MFSAATTDANERRRNDDEPTRNPDGSAPRSPPGRLRGQQGCRLALEGKTGEAHAADAEIAELHRLLFIESNPIPVKWAVVQLGFGELNLRLPMTELSSEHREPLRQALIASGAL